MARQNVAFLYGRVSKAPIVQINQETGEYVYGMGYLDTVRGMRPIDDGIRFLKHDHPLIISREKEILDKMRTWQPNDIVFVKGVVSSKAIGKTSFCPFCKDEGGNPTKNSVRGNLIYITPIYVERVKSFDNKAEAVEDLVANREISNQVYVVGTLIQEPQYFTTKQGVRITQYRIAIDRKFRVRTDDPIIKADWPVVKNYGEAALQDKVMLQKKAEILADGFLQARTVTRKVKCACCGKIYEYKDHSMEIVPYAMEYLRGEKSEEEVEAEYGMTIEEVKQQIFQSAYRDNLSEDMKSDDIRDENAGKTQAEETPSADPQTSLSTEDENSGE